MASSISPPRFPCWCQATYSWGGESKKDLGFIEGDLIEALNAGDGSWWMGRLRRDPRAIGLFPSNFVKVLDQSFQPAPNHRNASPLQQQQPASRTDSGKFRKPFQSYEKLGPRGSLENSREGTPDSDREKKKEKKSKFRPYSSMKTAQPPMSTLQKQASINGTPPPRDDRPRIPEPLPRRGSRAPSPQVDPLQHQHSIRPVSNIRHRRTESLKEVDSPARINSTSVSTPLPRSHSPQPATFYETPVAQSTFSRSRQPSPYEYEYENEDHNATTFPSNPNTSYDHEPYSANHHEDDPSSSPPPPPPPAHRTAFQPSRAPSPQPGRRESHTPSSHSPGARMTPSPLRDAMNDVMMSLQDMSMYQQPRHSRSPSPMPELRENGEVWSPDAFEMVRSRSIAEQRVSSSQSIPYHQHHDSQGHGRNSWSLDQSGLDLDNAHEHHIPGHAHGAKQKVGSYVQRMESQLERMSSHASYASDQPPEPPLKGAQFSQAAANPGDIDNPPFEEPLLPTLPRQTKLRNRKSAYELGDSYNSVNRMYSTKTNVTNSTATSSATQSSASTQLTSRSIMSGYSAGGFSATSAGSLARRKFEPLVDNNDQTGFNPADRRSMIDLSTRSIMDDDNISGPSYHESHATHNQIVPTTSPDWSNESNDSPGVFGGMVAPKARKSGFFRKMIDSARSTARTGAATARSTLGHANSSRPSSRAGSVSPTKSMLGMGGSISGGLSSRPTSAHGNAAREMGLGGGAMGNEWMQVRRDVNRSNTLSRKERDERIERCEMHDKLCMMPIELLNEYAEGNEGLDGLPIEEPTDFNLANLQLVDKSARFVQNIPPMISASSLAQSYICRPYRSDVQRLRAIFTWVAERITWEDDYDGAGDSRRVIQTKRGSSQEIAVLVREMCLAVGLHAEAVRGYLKAPGENLDLDTLARPNHWWNAVIVDGEWRIMDCALAGPTHPRRGAYTCASSQAAESWYFLARPLETCYSHIPLLPEQQHIVPPIDHAILVSLPCAVPAYFRNGLELHAFNTGLLQLENLEMAHLHVNVPEDVECIAETEARAYAQDNDGDFFESGEVVRRRAFSQAEWVDGQKRFAIKAVLPGDDGQGTLKVYAGKRGLMHSIRDNPHALAFAVPLTHIGQNPPYEFHLRHPTPHAQRHDLYVVQPQCSKLVLNNTFVFCVRQHPSYLSRQPPDAMIGVNKPGPGGFAARPSSPSPYARPTSAMSMASGTISLASSSAYSDPSSTGGTGSAQQKPAKLAIQSPSQKIIRLTRKQDQQGHSVTYSAEGANGLTTSWETVVKIGERGTWRGLVLADRSARWCVFAEWECA